MTNGYNRGMITGRINPASIKANALITGKRNGIVGPINIRTNITAGTTIGRHLR